MRLTPPTLALVLAALLAGCGGSSKSRAKAPASNPSASAGRHYTLKWAKVPSACPPGGCSGFEIQYGFAYNEPKLTKAQAIQQATKFAHRTSPVVLHMTCHSIPSGWSCTYHGPS